MTFTYGVPVQATVCETPAVLYWKSTGPVVVVDTYAIQTDGLASQSDIDLDFVLGTYAQGNLEPTCTSDEGAGSEESCSGIPLSDGLHYVEVTVFEWTAAESEWSFTFTVTQTPAGSSSGGGASSSGAQSSSAGTSSAGGSSSGA